MGQSNNNSIEFHFFCVKDNKSIVIKLILNVKKFIQKKNP